MNKHHHTTDAKMASQNYLVLNVTPERLPVQVVLHVTAPCWCKLYSR